MAAPHQRLSFCFPSTSQSFCVQEPITNEFITVFEFPLSTCDPVTETVTSSFFPHWKYDHKTFRIEDAQSVIASQQSEISSQGTSDFVAQTLQADHLCQFGRTMSGESQPGYVGNPGHAVLSTNAHVAYQGARMIQGIHDHLEGKLPITDAIPSF